MFSCVTPPFTLDTVDRRVYCYNSLELVVYKRTLDINSWDELSRTIHLSDYSIHFCCLLNCNLIIIDLDLGMIILHKLHTWLPEPLEGKLRCEEYSDYILMVLQEYLAVIMMFLLMFWLIPPVITIDRSCVDYICTDEDLDLLNEFPHNKLRLKT